MYNIHLFRLDTEVVCSDLSMDSNNVAKVVLAPGLEFLGKVADKSISLSLFLLDPE